VYRRLEIANVLPALLFPAPQIWMDHMLDFVALLIVLLGSGKIHLNWSVAEHIAVGVTGSASKHLETEVVSLHLSRVWVQASYVLPAAVAEDVVSDTPVAVVVAVVAVAVAVAAVVAVAVDIPVPARSTAVVVAVVVRLD